MITMTRDFSFSVQTTLGFPEVINQLRESLRCEGFGLLAEVPFHREFEWDHGLKWRKYCVLVVWSPCHAYQALLSDRDGGLFVPFNIIVAADDVNTFVAAGNNAHIAHDSSVALQVLIRDLNQKLRAILARLAQKENGSKLRQHPRPAV